MGLLKAMVLKQEHNPFPQNHKPFIRIILLTTKYSNISLKVEIFSWILRDKFDFLLKNFEYCTEISLSSLGFWRSIQ